MRTPEPPQLLPADFLTIVGAITRMICALKGSSDTGHGIGHGRHVAIEDDYGYSRAARELEAAVHSIHHFPTSGPLLHRMHLHSTRVSNMLVAEMREILEPLSVVAARSAQPLGLSWMNVSDYCQYYNVGAGGPWNALISEEFAELYTAWFGAVKFAPTSIAAPVMGTLARRAVGANEVQVGFVDPERYAGVRIGSSFNGTDNLQGIVTVVGAARARYGQVVDNRVWTGPIGGELVPEHEGDLCLSVRQIGIPATITNGIVEIYDLRTGGVQ